MALTMIKIKRYNFKLMSLNDVDEISFEYIWFNKDKILFIESIKDNKTFCNVGLGDTIFICKTKEINKLLNLK